MKDLKGKVTVSFNSPNTSDIPNSSQRSYIVVEWDRVRQASWSTDEVREVTRLSSTHVVLVFRSRKFAPEFQETDQSKDLPFGIVTNSIPKSRWVGFRRERCSIHLHGPREFDAVGMNNVSNEGKHGNSSVLNLGVTKEANRFFVGGSPEGGFSQVQRIIELDNRIQILGKCLQVGLGLLYRNRWPGVVGGRCECSSRSGEGKKDGGRLHLDGAYWCCKQRGGNKARLHAACP